MPKIGVVIVNWNGAKDTEACLRSLQAPSYGDLDIVVVDNASTDGSAGKIRASFPAVDLLEMPTNGGFGSGANAGMRRLFERGIELVWLLNNDTVVDDGALDALVTKIQEDPRIGAVASVTFHLDAPSKVQAWGGGTVDLWLGAMRVATRPVREDALHFLSAASLLVRREAIERVGMFDTGYFLYWEDTDLGFRLRANGFRLAVAPASRIWHKESAGTGGGRNARAYDYYVHSARRFFRAHAPAPFIPNTIRTLGGLFKWGLLGDRSRVRSLVNASREPCGRSEQAPSVPAEPPWVSPRTTEAPLVSVCIPVHDGARHIRGAIYSVLTQEYPNVLLRVIDNASTDGTRELVRAIDDPRVELVCFDHLVPVADSWARALRHGVGKYVLLLASDDWLLPGALATLVQAAEQEPNYALTFGRATYVLEAGAGGHLDRPHRAPAIGHVENVERYVLLHGYNVAIGGTLFRVGAPGLSIDSASKNACDLDLLLRLGREGASAFGVPEEVLALREHAAALSTDRVKMAEVTLETLRMHASGAPEPRLYVLRSQRVLAWAVIRLLKDGEVTKAKGLLDRHASACAPAWRGLLRVLVRFPWLRFVPLTMRRVVAAVRGPVIAGSEGFPGRAA